MTENVNLFERVIVDCERNAAKHIKVENGDYEKDGLIYCGKCNTQKQTELKMGDRIIKPMCLCKCAEAAQKAEEEETRRQKRAAYIEELRREGFPQSSMYNWTFEADDGQNEKITNIAKRYVENFAVMKSKGKGLLFYGNVGTGKTYFAACIVNALIDTGVPCLMTNFSRLTNTISGMYEGKQNYIDDLNKYELLVIDDLAAERDTEYMNEIVQNVIDSRYRAGLPTIITTNLTAEEIKNPAEIRKQRTYSRLLEMCVPIEVKGNDRRREKLKRDYAELNDLLGLSE